MCYACTVYCIYIAVKRQYNMANNKALGQGDKWVSGSRSALFSCLG